MSIREIDDFRKKADLLKESLKGFPQIYDNDHTKCTKAFYDLYNRTISHIAEVMDLDKNIIPKVIITKNVFGCKKTFGFYSQHVNAIFIAADTIINKLSKEEWSPLKETIETHEYVKASPFYFCLAAINILSHELAHFKQCENDLLKIDGENLLAYWRDGIYNLKEEGVTHYSLPWERDANGVASYASKKIFKDQEYIWGIVKELYSHGHKSILQAPKNRLDRFLNCIGLWNGQTRLFGENYDEVPHC